MQRSLRLEERTFIGLLLTKVSASDCYNQDLNECSVIEHKDGGMGSLKFVYNDYKNDKFGSKLLEAEFTEDNVLVSATLNVDGSNRLYELDVWKVDFSPVKGLPTTSSEITIK